MERIPYYCRMGREELNALTLGNELKWLNQVIQYQFSSYFKQESVVENIDELLPPNIENDTSIYASLIRDLNLDFQSRLVLILALAPHVRPQMLDPFFTKSTDYNRGFTEFGGLKGDNHGGFLPTGETAAFLYSGLDLSKRLQVIKVFETGHVFYRKNILKLDITKENEPYLSGALALSNDYIDLITLGEVKKPSFSSKFPATLVETKMSWKDLVLDKSAKKSVNHIKTWIEHNVLIMEDWNMKDKIKPGYRALFYGPPGTGKTLTASLLGAATGKDVYKIDISMISSKWVGETEKNLARIFDAAETKDWILFFDEADSIFGKRGGSGSAQDKHSNQEVSYLLQRTEEYPGVVILASNLKGNIDEAFIRRFQSMIYFKMPTPDERFKLWSKSFDSGLSIENDVDLYEISKAYELSGGAIVNVLKHCSITAVQKNKKTVSKNDLITAIKYELLKEGKMG